VKRRYILTPDLKASPEWFKTATFAGNFDCDYYYPPIDVTSTCVRSSDGYHNEQMNSTDNIGVFDDLTQATTAGNFAFTTKSANGLSSEDFVTEYGTWKNDY